VGMVWLGFWQLGRAEEKRVIQARDAERARQDPVDLVKMIGGDYPELTRVYVTGSYDTRRHLLLDNRVHEGVAGYEVLTPVKLAGSDTAILVNRGWIPMGKSRQHLPQVVTNDQKVDVIAILKKPSETVFDIPPSEAYSKGWPKVVQHIRTEELAQLIGYPLLPVVALLDPGQPDGFIRQWKFISMPPEKHLSYALQWFGLATALGIIFILVNTYRIEDGNPDE
jgi:surfeit locus 1 family protein